MSHQPQQSEIQIDIAGSSDAQTNGLNPNIEGKKGKTKRDSVILAYKTLGVVFGGLSTSPLYIFCSLPLKSPTEDDYLGIYSIMFWTLTLIGVKYAGIAVNAGDHGEGGTFALYSLLCRRLNIGILPSKLGSLNTSGSDSIPPGDTRNTTWLAKVFQESIVARRTLLFIAMAGTCMMIGDGILTPAISVLSAMEGIKAPFPAVTNTHVEILSAVVLVILFLLQRFGTSRVSFLFSPVMVAWTVTTPLVGTYRFIHHYPAVFKALSPHYIARFFIKNGKTGWSLLAGIVLVITGSEAMFADLGHFNQRSIQIAFLFAVYPSLVLTYAGQTAYLIKNPNDFGDGFYKFIPNAVYWPMFIVASLTAIVASQSLISATFSIIKQSVVLDYFPRVKIVHTSSKNEGRVYSPEVNYFLMVLCVAVILIFGDGQKIGNAFGVVVSCVMLITSTLLILVMIMIWRTHPLLVALYACIYVVMEGVYVSSVMTKFAQGGWLPFGISLILAIIMFGWYYGRQKKVQYELANKISSERLKELLADPRVLRTPGICFFYTNIQDGFTPVLEHYVSNIKALHQVTILTTLRYLLVPKVTPLQRVVIKKLEPQGLYGCVIQYGYADSLKEEYDFADLVTHSLMEQITNSPDDSYEIEEMISSIEEATPAGVVHIRGKTRFYCGPNSKWYDRILLAFYEAMHGICRSALPTLGVPLQQQFEMGTGMIYEV
ncbi:hypothetical protein L6164_001277 [Bauhinia variegata]|uniref:Uncharacterized protein n=1 Tax=Bauhinia variegata TaxID=167791 RepID=A0ACB9Q963_BAUVA|nr:hypothetical protein L6164_001277 [Bauhinia variegata]